MALDGAFLRHIKKELTDSVIDSKVDKIYQPSRDQLIITLRSREGVKKLLVSARAGSSRIHLTETSPENPKTPPMLCMLLRKKLTGARLRDIRQPGLERLLMLDFEGLNELGDTVTMTLAVEIMGQYSNIVLLDGEGIIIDAFRRVDASMSSQRLVLPGMRYELPPAQDKLCVLEKNADDIIDAVRALPKNMPLSKALLTVVQGVSPILCREWEHLTGRGRDVFSHELDEDLTTRLRFFLKRTIAAVRDVSGEPYIITDETKKPIDFTFEPIQQYGSGRSLKETASFSELLDAYYARRDAIETMRRRSEDLNRLMNNAATRAIKKIYAQKDELSRCSQREQYRIYGDIIQANLYRIEKGADELTADNFYDENMGKITIPLDPSLSAAANSQRYYKLYRKAKTAEQVLKVQIKKAEDELDYVSSVLDALSRAESVKELSEIRSELTEQGYIRSKGKAKRRTEAPVPPLSFVSESGFTILVGRNNRQNDHLTLKQAEKNDLWFHAKGVPGAHAVILSKGSEPDEETILFAASLAAAHSRAAGTGQDAQSAFKIPVDYTRIRYVSKPNGAKPGMVIYTNERTVFVKPWQQEQK